MLLAILAVPFVFDMSDAVLAAGSVLLEALQSKDGTSRKTGVPPRPSLNLLR
jgi:hypothetical protein